MKPDRIIILRVRPGMGDENPYYTGAGRGPDPDSWSAKRSDAIRWVNVQAAYRWLRKHAPELRPIYGAADPMAFYSIPKDET